MRASMQQCVIDVQAKGRNASDAWAICRSAIDMSESKTQDDVMGIVDEILEREKVGDIKFDQLETRDIEGVEIFAVGMWNGIKFTAKDLEDMVQAHTEVGDKVKPYLKLGHDKGQKFGQSDGLPAMGWIENLRVRGEKLLADFKKIPKKIADIIDIGGYRRVSAEIYMNAKIGGKKFPKVLKAIALLGGDTPAVQNLRDIVSLYASYGEVKAFEGSATEKSFELEVSEINKKEDDDMKTVEQLQAELAETQKKLGEAEARFTEASKKSEEQITALKADKTALETSNKELSAKVEKFTQDAHKAIATAKVESLIKGGHILPAQKEGIYTMLVEALNEPEEKKFTVKTKVKEGEAEVEKDVQMNKFEFVSHFMERGKVDVNIEEESNAGERQAGEDALLAKAQAFIEKNKAEGRSVSLKEALIEVSPADEQN